VDFSFKPEIMEKILKKTKNVFWIDHHKTAMEYKYSSMPAGLRSNKYSGCELTWKYFFPNKARPWAVRLIGDYDTWTLAYEHETSCFCEGLKLHLHGPTAPIWNRLLSNSVSARSEIDDICMEGATCLKYKDNFCSNYRKNFGHEVVFEGYKACALNLATLGSAVFGSLINKYDLLITYVFDGRKWTYHLYSEGKIDVSEIAKAHGGGGHAGAAGFVTEDFLFGRN